MHMKEKIMIINIRKKLLEMPKWRRQGAASKIIKDLLGKKIKNLKIDKTLNEKICTGMTKLKLKIVESDKETKVELA